MSDKAYFLVFDRITSTSSFPVNKRKLEFKIKEPRMIKPSQAHRMPHSKSLSNTESKVISKEKFLQGLGNQLAYASTLKPLKILISNPTLLTTAFLDARM